MPSSFAGAYWRTKDVEDKSATRTGSLAEGHVDQYAMGGHDTPTDPGKNMRRLFQLSTAFMLASRERRSVLRRDWRNQRFLKEQASHNARAEEEAAAAASERRKLSTTSTQSQGGKRKVVRIQSDPWTEWRDAHQRRQAEAAREKHIEGLRTRPKELIPLEQFLVQAAPVMATATTRTTTRSSTSETADGADSGSNNTPAASDARSTATPTSTDYEPPVDHRHHTPVLGLLSAVKREAASLAKEPRKTKPSTSAEAIAKRGAATVEHKAPPKHEREPPAADMDDDFQPKKLTKSDRVSSDLLDLYDDAAVSLMSGYSGSMPGRARATPRPKAAKKAPTWDMHDDMTVHFMASLAGARSVSPGGDLTMQPRASSSGGWAGKSYTTTANSNGTLSPASPETPGGSDALQEASRGRDRGSAMAPRIEVTAE